MCDTGQSLASFTRTLTLGKLGMSLSIQHSRCWKFRLTDGCFISHMDKIFCTSVCGCEVASAQCFFMEDLLFVSLLFAGRTGIWLWQSELKSFQKGKNAFVKLTQSALDNLSLGLTQAL